MPIDEEPKSNNPEETNNNPDSPEDSLTIAKIRENINLLTKGLDDIKDKEKLLQILLEQVIKCPDNKQRAYLIAGFVREHPKIIKARKGKEHGASRTLSRALMMGDREGKLNYNIWQLIHRYCGSYDLFKREEEKLKPLLEEVIKEENEKNRADLIIDFIRANPELIKVKNKEHGASITLAQALMMGDREEKLNESRWYAITRQCTAHDLFEKEEEKLKPLLEKVIEEEKNKTRSYLIIDFIRANPELIKVKEKEYGASTTLAQALMMGDREGKLNDSEWQSIRRGCGNYDLFEREEKKLKPLFEKVIEEEENKARSYSIIDFIRANPELIKVKNKEHGASITLAQALTMWDREGKLNESEWQTIHRGCSNYDLFEREKEKLKSLLEEVIKEKNNKARSYLIIDFIRTNPELIKVKEKEHGASGTLAQVLTMGDRVKRLNYNKDWHVITRQCTAYDLFKRHENFLFPLLEKIIEEENNKARSYLITDFIRMHPNIIQTKGKKERGASSTLAQALMMGDREEKLSNTKDWRSIAYKCAAYDYALEYFPLLEVDLQKIYPDVINYFINLKKKRLITQDNFYKQLKKRISKIYGTRLEKISKDELKSKNFPYRQRKDPTTPISDRYFINVKHAFIRELQKRKRFDQTDYSEAA